MKVTRIPFRIIEHTSADPEYAAENLTVPHSPFATGWQSERFCIFPQTITLELAQPSRIYKLQILSHHFKISSRIEIYISATKGQFTRLGFVSLKDNGENSFNARELKTIHIDAKASQIRFVLHRCFVNALNLYNQV
jgi:centrosomal protein CEP104